MAIDMNDTLQMMQAIERSKAPASFLLDTFFPVVAPVATTEMVGVEFRKGARMLAPYVTAGQGVNIARDGSNIRFYKPPMMAPRRVINDYDVNGRAFGEAILGSKTPQERASELQARDFSELQQMIVNRKNQMAAELLTSGKITIKGYADDGKTAKVDTIDFSEDWKQEAKVSTPWSNASANILDDIEAASEAIQENAGMIPTVMLVGRNVKNYMLQNKQIMDYLNVTNRQNLTLLGLAPKLTAPQVGRIGYIDFLNLEIYTYAETYLDDDGQVKPFLGPDDVIISIPGRGKQIHGAINLVDAQSKTLHTYAGAYVPRYTANESDNSLALTMYSRCILVPETCDDWAVIHTTTTE